MNKYSDIEIQIAQNLLENGFKWITRGIYGAIIAYKSKPDKEKYGYGNVICSDLVPVFESIRHGDEPVSIESIVHPPILDDVERRYLSAVIRPFRDKVQSIKKFNGLYVSHCFDEILVYYESFGRDLWFSLPPFEKGTMYKGMKPDRKYSLEELGL